MGKRYFQQVRKHFQFLVDEHGFSVEQEVDGGRYLMVVFQQTDSAHPNICRIRVPYQEGRVQVDVAPISSPDDWFGLATILLALWVDIRSRRSGDYAFWLYLFGVVAFWGGLTSQDSDSEWAKFAYFCINIALIGVGAVLNRRVFVVFGGLGAAVYFGHLAANVFEDSWLFPVALTAIGLLIIYLGIVWQKHEKTITRRLRSVLPAALRELLDARA